MTEEYYFVSDLHIGGDGELQKCDFDDEFIQFLSDLEIKDKSTELLIVGDSFGLWEFTELTGIEKLEELIKYHQRLFDQFRATGEKITITIIPGNHDYELACFPEFIKRLNDFNIILEPEVSVTRNICGKKIVIEHGMQDDEYNAMPDFGNPYANPLGFFITRNVVATAGKQSKQGRYNWLKDLQSVSPMEDLPNWMLSNYFYKEMSLFLRLLILPFLILFTVSIVVLIGGFLEEYGLLGTRVFTDNKILSSLGFVGSILDAIFYINGILILFLIPVSIPIWLIIRDFKRTLERFKILTKEDLISEKDNVYIEKAKNIFKKNQDVLIYLFGHTHHAFLKEIDGRAIINTGTWLKQLKRVSTHFRLLPDVYSPHYCLNYFRVRNENNNLIINYSVIEKEAPRELSLLQRIVTFRKRKFMDCNIAEETKLKL